MVLALTVGDPSGIGPDIALKAYEMRAKEARFSFALIADPAQISARAQRLGLSIKVRECSPEQAAAVFSDALPILPLVNRHRESPGLSLPENAAGTVEAIDTAVRLTLEGRMEAVVTCPIAKKPLYDAGFKFPGHTEYLAHLCARPGEPVLLPVMMLAGPLLKTVPVTIHIALKDVPTRLTAKLIVETGRIVAGGLQSRFGIANPRLAIAGLNPHAGEGGALGMEDETNVRPAVEQLKAEGIGAFGPLPADTMFHAAARANYDAALCMYHDQALIPAKALGFDDSVNVTLGLPLIRTSPDHGTAFGIAGTGQARADSLIAALTMAAQMVECSHAQH